MSHNATILGGIAGTSLTQGERAFFRAADPWGFILFSRNVESPAQLRRLTGDLREAVGRDAVITVDQEGGGSSACAHRIGANGARRWIRRRRARGRCGCVIA